MSIWSYINIIFVISRQLFQKSVFEKIINIDIPLDVKIYLDASIFDISGEQSFRNFETIEYVRAK